MRLPLRANNTEDSMGLRRSVSAIAVALFLHSAVMRAADQASCTFDTFSAPPGYSLSQVNGVSDDGTVVGQLIDNSTQQFVAFQRSAGGVINKYPAPQSSATWLYGRNGTGASAGFYQDTIHPENVHGFLLQGAKFAAVNRPNTANTWLFNVNLLGASVGSFTAGPSQVKGFMLVNGTYTTIDYPHSRYGTVLTAVNNSGVIVGNHLSANRDFGFIYENGDFKSIVYPSARNTKAGGINNNGLISGQVYFTGNNTLGYTALCK